MDDNFFPEDDIPVSKSQRKREMLALQDLGKTLTELDQGLLAKCKLPTELSLAIAEFKRLPNKHEARRRQLQFIGRLMRDIDTSTIEAVINKNQHQANLDRLFFQQLETLREKLLAGSEETLQALIQEHPDLEIQHIRQLIRQAKKEVDNNKPPAASRKLFQYLRELRQKN